MILSVICLSAFLVLMSVKPRSHSYPEPVVKKVSAQYGMKPENLSAIILSLEKERVAYLESQDLFY